MPPAIDFSHSFAAALSSAEAAKILDHFSQANPGVSCLFGHQEAWARGASAVAQAITTFSLRAPRPNVTFSAVTSHTVGRSSALVSGNMTYQWEEDGRSLAQQSRFNMVLRDQAGEFRCLHFAEAPIAPLIQLQQYYQHIARQGHPT